ncbi:hypothetical protein SELMODRAFT_412242 [Selaginella moellendorffii]|uniref:S1 motif domain-containing protein n=1 Tax=Selaginella moellendorffii TaxID=88036 RepID=D8RKI8_SELML|nr:hypothetical protein SELMODRAFT_412242 [Selaginella moellendorffii]
MGGDQCIHKRSQITQEIASWRLQHSIVLGLADKPCPMDSHCFLRGNVHITECWARAKILSKRKTSRKHRNATTLDLSLRPSELAGNDAACSVITFETVTIEQSVIRYVQEVKDNWAWLVLSPHLKGCLFILDTSDDPSELERFKERFKVGDPFQCHIRKRGPVRPTDYTSFCWCWDILCKADGKVSENQFIYRGTVRKVLDLKRPGRGKMGLELSGFVKNVTEKGCFVVLAPSLEARIQLKNLSNSFVQNPAEMFPPGKVISGRILSIKPLSGHIEMSLTATTSQDSSGWKKFGAGEIVSGRIHNIEAFGIFISLAESDVFLVCAPGCLCHVSEVSYDFIQDLSTLYKVGQWVQVKILKVDAETKRISLGMKASYLTEPMEEEAINEEPSNTNVPTIVSIHARTLVPPMPPISNQYAARACQNVRSRYVDTFNKGSVTPSKTSSDSPPLFGVVPKASAKPLAPARFFVPAAAAAAAPDINSNHSVDPSSAPTFVSDTAFSNGNGTFAQLVVQDMRNDPGPTPDHLSSSSSPAMFYSNHYPAAPSTVSLPPPPALQVTPPVMVEQQQQNQHQESSIHRHHHQQSGTVGFEAASSSGVFGDDLQEVEL